MFTNVEPVLARTEKSKLFIFLLKIAFGKPKKRNVDFFFLEVFFKVYRQKFVAVSLLFKNKQNLVTHTLS